MSVVVCVDSYILIVAEVPPCALDPTALSVLEITAKTAGYVCLVALFKHMSESSKPGAGALACKSISNCKLFAVTSKYPFAKDALN